MTWKVSLFLARLVILGLAAFLWLPAGIALLAMFLLWDVRGMIRDDERKANRY